jgi:quinol monooxygenase YgiN
MAIKRINHFHAAAGREEALRAFLQSVISVIKGATGCQAVELLVDHEDGSQLVIVEQWNDVASHQTAARLVPPTKLAEIGPLLAEPPKGRYYDFGSGRRRVIGINPRRRGGGFPPGTSSASCIPPPERPLAPETARFCVGRAQGPGHVHSQCLLTAFRGRIYRLFAFCVFALTLGRVQVNTTGRATAGAPGARRHDYLRQGWLTVVERPPRRKPAWDF